MSVEQGRFLDENESKTLIAGYGVQTPRRWIVGRNSAPSFPADISTLAVKALSTTFAHKTELGAVQLQVAPGEVGQVISAMTDRLASQGATAEGFLVEEMARDGVDLVVGAVVDEAFGPCVMVGLGGIFVEVVDDVAFGMCPVTRDDAHAMLGALRCQAVLDGARGTRGVDREAIVDIIMALGGSDGVMMTSPQVHEVDINPVRATDTGALALDAFVRLGAVRPVDTERAERPNVLDRVLQPSSVAVVGASASGGAPGNVFLKNIREQGFAGRIYPVHPVAETIDGLPAVTSVADLPEPVDYTFVAIAGRMVPALIAAADGNLRVVQVMSSGFGETKDGGELQEDLVSAARASGATVIGPNCLGVYSPRGGLSFASRSPKESGSVAVISQSGGLGAEVIHRGAVAGVRFSGVVSIGNGADLSAADFLEMFLADDDTHVIGMYVEDAREAPAMLRLLRENPRDTPVVLLRGGRTEAGRVTAAGHTGSLAGGDRLWSAFARQANVILADTLGQFVDLLRLLEIVQGRSGSLPAADAILIGNGGGVSVLGADAVDDAGLRISTFDPARQQLFDPLDIPAGMSIVNPIDVPAGAFEIRDGALLNGVFDVISHWSADYVLIPHVNLPVVQDNLVAPTEAIERFISGCARIAQASDSVLPPLIVLRSDASETSDAFRRWATNVAMTAGLPVFTEIADAARAARRLLDWGRAARTVMEASA